MDSFQTIRNRITNYQEKIDALISTKEVEEEKLLFSKQINRIVSSFVFERGGVIEEILIDSSNIYFHIADIKDLDSLLIALKNNYKNSKLEKQVIVVPLRNI